MMFRLLCVLSLVALVSMELVLQAQIKNQWEKFKSKHLKSYKDGEEQTRQENFKNNVEKILEHNLKADLGEHEHRLAVNEFSDMSHEEFSQKMLGFKTPLVRPNTTTLQAPLPGNAPAQIDWRQYGVVTRIKNQQTCGSCYTFASAGALESRWAIATGQLVELSEQNLLDCANEAYGYYNMGCNGGFPDMAFQYVINNQGISVASCYPYQNALGQCRYNPSCRGATMRAFGNVPQGDERTMMQAVAAGPVSVGLDAGQPDFMNYRSGIYNNPRCNNVQGNHAVQVVGYGSEAGRDYWLIKNSWGTTWGEGGFMRMARNSNNMCGIAQAASYPIV